MLERSKTQFEGFDCVKLENEHVSLWITKSLGPRIIGLSAFGGKNMLAVLPNAKYEFPGQEDYYFRGGHRLWYSPEQPETTYIQDNSPVRVEEIDDGIKLIQPVDPPSYVQKSFRIRLSDTRAEVEIEHSLTNLGDNSINLAPWAVTQLRPGGVGIFPQQTSVDDEYGFWPNRQIILWPYTNINSPYIHWGNEAVTIDANMNDGALKIGFPNPDGWLAYALQDRLFVKRAQYDPDAKYLDRGASSQIYCCETFIELETLGPHTTLESGDSVVHEETWEIYQDGQWPGEISALFSGLNKE